MGTNNKKKFYLDLLERSAWTFAQAGLGFWIDHATTGEVTFRGVLIAAGLAVAKALFVSKLPWTANDSASTLPQEVVES